MSHQVIFCPPEWLQFLCGFASRPSDVASLWPSSRGLQRRLAGLPCLRRAKLVIELGPGLGGTTRALLESMPADSRLIGIEIVEQFAESLRTIPDQRLQVVHGRARDLEPVLRGQGLQRPDVIVSGIPFAAMSRGEGADLVKRIHAVLPAGGIFVAYQFRKRVSELAAECFGPPRESLVLGNFPPLRIYEWRKGAAVTPTDGLPPRTRSLTRQINPLLAADPHCSSRPA
jgi:phosphatidylethanolamine/phosphatidyl-N-methylethanolamine N-methyltransferase